MRRIRRGHASQAAQAESRVSPIVDPSPPLAAAPADAQLAALEVALQGLYSAMKIAASEGSQAPSDWSLEDIQVAGAILARKRLALEGALPEGGAEQLERALVAAEVRASVGGPGAEDHASEVRALAQRLTALRELTSTLDRLRARERALLHEVEVLRLTTLQASARDVGERPDVAAQTLRLVQEVRAVDEVDEVLARALRAAAAHQVRH